MILSTLSFWKWPEIESLHTFLSGRASFQRDINRKCSLNPETTRFNQQKNTTNPAQKVAPRKRRGSGGKMAHQYKTRSILSRCFWQRENKATNLFFVGKVSYSQLPSSRSNSDDFLLNKLQLFHPHHAKNIKLKWNKPSKSSFSATSDDVSNMFHTNFTFKKGVPKATPPETSTQKISLDPKHLHIC